MNLSSFKFEFEELYKQTSASGTWGEHYNHTVKNLNSYKAIYVSVLSNNTTINNSTLVPMSYFKSGITAGSAYEANKYACFAKYINDTTIGVSTVGFGILVLGVK